MSPPPNAKKRSLAVQTRCQQITPERQEQRAARCRGHAHTKRNSLILCYTLNVQRKCAPRATAELCNVLAASFVLLKQQALTMLHIVETHSSASARQCAEELTPATNAAPYKSPHWCFDEAARHCFSCWFINCSARQIHTEPYRTT